MFVIIIGCGRLGSYLAAALSEQGQEVVIIDRHEATFDKLPEYFTGFGIAGDASEPAVLESAGIARCDALLAVTENDNTNILIAQMARELFRTPKVMARVFDPARAEVYESLGIEAICPTILGGAKFIELLGAS
jgi:trk system potassium uptake protein TrkA